NVFKFRKERIKDLLEIAGYIFAADRKTSRGAKDAVEYHSWSRCFHFHFKVRDLDFWNLPDVKKVLSEALCFMTGDYSYEFTFHKIETDTPANIFDNENFALDAKKNLSVILFSGGLDSLAGVIEKINTTEDEICLVSHQSGNPAVKKTQNQMYKGIESRYPGRCKHYKFHCSLKKIKSVDETQRTRSLLYTATAFAIANTYNQNNIYVYENGITTINFAKTQDLMLGRASRTTHPKTIKLLEKLFTEIAEEPFKIEHPYFFNTKTDIVEIIKKYERTDLINSAVTCSRTRNHAPDFTHCGWCSQCIDRIFAMYATETEESDEGVYYYKFYKGKIKKEEIRRAVIDYLRLVDEFANTDLNYFYIKRADEIIDVIEYSEGNSDGEKYENVYNLCQKHARQVEYAIERLNNIYNKPFSTEETGTFFSIIVGTKAYQNIKNAQVKSISDEENEASKKKGKPAIEEQVKLYIKTCNEINIVEPTLEQLFDITEIPKTTWYKLLKKSSFWHILMDETEHSINQAKKQGRRDFWIEVKQFAHNKYADLLMKETGQRERGIDDLPKRNRGSF
ncbi:MAG: 7-cyano-7-deazaguanine synthase, partial [Ignavibacteria bacterium]